MRCNGGNLRGALDIPTTYQAATGAQLSKSTHQNRLALALAVGFSRRDRLSPQVPKAARGHHELGDGCTWSMFMPMSGLHFLRLFRTFLFIMSVSDSCSPSITRLSPAQALWRCPLRLFFWLPPSLFAFCSLYQCHTPALVHMTP